MKWTKIIVGAFCLFAMLGGPSAQAGDSKIQEIKSNGALRICHAEALPMNYKDPKTGNWTGDRKSVV